MCTLVGHFRRAYGTSTPDPMRPDGARRREHGRPARHPPGAPGPPPAGPAVRGHRRRPAETVVERVYAHAGMTLSDGAARATCCAGTQQNAMHKLGDVQYSLDEIGLDEAVIRDRMRSYFELLDQLADGRSARPGQAVGCPPCPPPEPSPEPVSGRPSSLRRSGRDRRPAAELESLGFSALWMHDVGGATYGSSRPAPWSQRLRGVHGELSGELLAGASSGEPARFAARRVRVEVVTYPGRCPLRDHDRPSCPG